MAIKYNSINSKTHNKNREPLNAEELAEVNLVEKYIDSEIRKKFTEGGSISILLHYVSFEQKIIKVNDEFQFSKEMVKRIPQRQHMQRSELNKRFREAGWECKVELDDGLDGPNMSGSDYWVLSGKATEQFDEKGGSVQKMWEVMDKSDKYDEIKAKIASMADIDSGEDVASIGAWIADYFGHM